MCGFFEETEGGFLKFPPNPSGILIMNGNVDAGPRWNDEIAAIISGVIGGGRYGLKIRVPHALGE